MLLLHLFLKRVDYWPNDCLVSKSRAIFTNYWICAYLTILSSYIVFIYDIQQFLQFFSTVDIFNNYKKEKSFPPEWIAIAK
jgi:hypothetical protein